MKRMIFVNLAVADLGRSRRFYTGLGFDVDARFSDERCACIIVSETICVMLVDRDRFGDFVAGPVADPAAGTAVINCLSAASPVEVDDLLNRALASGGRPWLDRLIEGPLYGGSFADPDGHVWEVLHLAPEG
ncbi:MAG TPA: VOC family protein [Microlunatus sp.]|nr:VOC family protein [Microlunatus sp.]